MVIEYCVNFVRVGYRYAIELHLCRDNVLIFYMSMADSNGHDYCLVALTGDVDVWSRDIIGIFIVNRYVLSPIKGKDPVINKLILHLRIHS